jgi:hypothetical protein
MAFNCLKLSQPAKYAVSKVAIFGCDKEQVMRLGWGQILRYANQCYSILYYSNYPLFCIRECGIASDEPRMGTDFEVR